MEETSLWSSARSTRSGRRLASPPGSEPGPDAGDIRVRAPGDAARRGGVARPRPESKPPHPNLSISLTDLSKIKIQCRLDYPDLSRTDSGLFELPICAIRKRVSFSLLIKIKFYCITAFLYTIYYSDL